MFRLVAVCVLCALVASPVLAQKQPPTKRPPGPVTQEVAATDTIIEACTEVYAATKPGDLEDLSNDLIAQHIATRDHLETQRQDLMGNWVDAATRFSSLRHWVNEGIMEMALTAGDYATHQAIQEEDAKPIVIEKLGEAIDMALGDGAADALSNPFLDEILALDKKLTRRIQEEYEAQQLAIAARRALVEHDARILVARAVVTGIQACIDEQAIYVGNIADVAAVADAPEAGRYRMDTGFTGGLPARIIDMPPDPGDIPYSPAPCHDICMAEQSCVGWNYVHSGEGPARCEIFDEGGDVAQSTRSNIDTRVFYFSGLGPKAVELGLARPFDGYD